MHRSNDRAQVETLAARTLNFPVGCVCTGEEELANSHNRWEVWSGLKYKTSHQANRIQNHFPIDAGGKFAA